MWEDALTSVVEEDIENFVSRPQSTPPEILVFPPLLDRYRYHIHQLVENRFPFLVTKSVGTDDDRRLTVSFRESGRYKTCEQAAISSMATAQLDNHNKRTSDSDLGKVDLPRRKTRPAMQTYVPPPQRNRPDSANFDRADQRCSSSLSSLPSGKDMGENPTRSRSTASNNMADRNKDYQNGKQRYFGTALRTEEERPGRGCDGSGDYVRRSNLRDRGQNSHRSGGQTGDFRAPQRKGGSIGSSYSAYSNGKASGDAVANPADYFKARRSKTPVEAKSSVGDDQKIREDELLSRSPKASNPESSPKTHIHDKERILPDLPSLQPEVLRETGATITQNEPATKMPDDRSAVPVPKQTKGGALPAEPKRAKPRFAQSQLVSQNTHPSAVVALPDSSSIKNDDPSTDSNSSKDTVVAAKSSSLIPSQQAAPGSPQRFPDSVKERDVAPHAVPKLSESSADNEGTKSLRPKFGTSPLAARDNPQIQRTVTQSSMNPKTRTGDGNAVLIHENGPKVEEAEPNRPRFGPGTVQPPVDSSPQNGMGTVSNETRSSFVVEESHRETVQSMSTTGCNESALPDEGEYQGFPLYRIRPEPVNVISSDWKRETRDLSQPYSESDFKQEQHEKRNLADLRGRLEQNASMDSSASPVKIMKRPHLISSPNIRSYKYIPQKRDFVLPMPDKEFKKFTEAMGEVSVVESQGDYRVFSPASDVSGQEFGHVLEVSNIPPEFATADLDKQIKLITQEYYDLKWVDDTHALAVFSNAASADNVLRMRNTGAKVVLKALVNAGELTRRKARLFLKLDDTDPARDRPDVNVGIARRMLGGALGMKIPVGRGVREQEIQQLREARDRKQKSIQRKEDIWEGNV